MVGFIKTGKGAVIMINANDDSGLMDKGFEGRSPKNIAGRNILADQMPGGP